MILTFPRYIGDIDALDPLPPSELNETEKPLREMRVLLVDDEPIVLRATQRLLGTLGARVIAVSNGHEALAVFRKRLPEIDLVLLDLVMPEMDGTVVLKQLREINPDVPALIASGFTPEPEKLSVLKSEIPRFEFLKKPYKAGRLVKAVGALGILHAGADVSGEKIS